MSARRWDVEVKPNTFEDVGADRVKVEHGGVLVFYTGSIFEERLAVAYAPGAWRTVTEQES